ncbi:hypothetical protein MPSEU_000189200 [Mayamaea pseudoterrestris]|nr:hypothetical protein MPSEU_000189200 [Mayamaea pseudoterrestris]
MVIRSGFEVQLVHADSKLPFKEHEKDGKIYVEVEPDAEYFIAIRRLNNTGPPAIVSQYSIDGKRLNYSRALSEKAEFTYDGIYSQMNGKSSTVTVRQASTSCERKWSSYSATGNISTCKKKFLLSEPGHSTRKTPVAHVSRHFIPGRDIETITLNYCSAVGLTDVGVIPKLSLWAGQRMVRPAPAGQLCAPSSMVSDPADATKEIELFDLTDESVLTMKK